MSRHTLQAFRGYYQAIFEKNDDRKSELSFGNALVVLSEQRKLQAPLNAILPWGSMTHPLATFVAQLDLAHETLHLNRDIPPTSNGDFPPALRNIDLPALEELLRTYDRTPNSLSGTAVADWWDLNQRMHFILDFFRSRQQDPTLQYAS
ncbi:MAG: hypothetical protein R3C68_15035 [Myxococcota bacterium]